MRAAGRGRRHRDDVMAAIGSADRQALFGAIFGEIVHRHAPARRPHRVDDSSRHRPGIEARRALGGDGLKGRGEIVERDVVADLGRVAVGLEKDARGRGMAGEHRRGEGERVGEIVVDGQALTRQRGGRRDEIGEGEFARTVFAPGELEARDRAGHADREAGKARLERIGLAVGVEKHVLGGPGGRRLAIVDRRRLVEIGAVDQHESAAAEIAGARQGDREREADRDAGVDRVAAEPQHLDADPRGGRVLAHHHAVPGDDRQGGGEAGDDRRGIGAGGGREKQEGEGGEAKSSQGVSLPKAFRPVRLKAATSASIETRPCRRSCRTTILLLYARPRREERCDAPSRRTSRRALFPVAVRRSTVSRSP